MSEVRQDLNEFRQSQGLDPDPVQLILSKHDSERFVSSLLSVGFLKELEELTKRVEALEKALSLGDRK